MKVITINKFTTQYRPLQNTVAKTSECNGCLFGLSKAEINYVREYAKAHPGKVWTVTLEPGENVISNGFHMVNRIGYILTEVAVPSNVDFIIVYNRKAITAPVVQGVQEISLDEFEEVYIPEQNEQDEDAAHCGWMYESFGAELAHVLAVKEDRPECIWTVIQGNNHEIISSGYQIVNRIGYIITEKPVLSRDVNVQVRVPYCQTEAK